MLKYYADDKINEVILYTQKKFKWEKLKYQMVDMPETPTLMFTNYSLEKRKNTANLS